MIGKISVVMAFAAAAFCGSGIAAAEYRVAETTTGVQMLRGGETLWNLEIETPEGRPFFHPLRLPSGRTITDLRPKDHVWHLGYWFSWKYINGANYWETTHDKRVQRSVGQTRVVRKSVDCDGLGCVVKLSLEYGPQGDSESVLAEERIITIDPPDAKGGYAISTRHLFKAMKDAVLDRTPPHGSTASGKWGGGYAGATLRLDPDVASAVTVRGHSGGKTPAAVTGTEKVSIDFVDPVAGEGFSFAQIAAPTTACFYVWRDLRMINPSALYAGPVTLKKGETLELAYRLAVFALPTSAMRGK